MRLVILGAGAIGGVVAGFLARAKRDVLVIARGAQLAAIRAGGLRVETPTEVFTAPLAVTTADAIAWRDDDVLVLAVKTQDVAAALREVAPPPRVPIACMTNGVEAERIALRHAETVYGVYVAAPMTYLTPGVVQAWASPIPGLLDVGRYPDGMGDHADALVGELLVAGFASDVRPNIMKWKRGKLISNLMNGAEALTGPAARLGDLADRAAREARAVFSAAGLSCTTEREDAEHRGRYTSHPIGGARRTGGSTWQSLARGATSIETDYLNGEIAMLGRIHGVATPVNTALQAIAAAAVRAGTAPGAWTLEELTARVDRYPATP